MKKLIIGIIFILSANACYKLPQREEIEYRNRLEDAIVNTFPKKVVVLIHPFKNLSPADTNRAYLETALPDSIEAMLEPMKSTLAYIPFDGMPFFVSAEISNLFQVVDNEEDDEDEDSEFDDSKETNTNQTYNRYEEAYFSYLTNYLLLVPVQVTQVEYEIETNTNYFEITTNLDFKNGESITNFLSNEILLTKTNNTTTNVVIKNKNLLTTTNMLMLIHEEFPELPQYLSYMPIEIRRATAEETELYEDNLEKQTDPKRWQAKQKKLAEKKKQKEAKEAKEAKEKSEENQEELTEEESEEEEEKSPYPDKAFDYTYHISGSFQTSQRNILESVETDIKIRISPAENTGLDWWQEKYNSAPPKLSSLIKLEASLDKDDLEAYKKIYMRTPFKKPKISPRLRDEFEAVSTNFRDDRPVLPKNSVNPKNNPTTFGMKVQEDRIPFALMDWLKYFHATIINRPYTVLKISTDPEKALVYLNGFYIGMTPLVYPTAPIGEQRVLFIKDGFNREEILVDVLVNQTNNINYTLQAQNDSGVLAITSSLPGAEVYLDSKYYGIAPLTISNLSLNKKFRLEILNPDANLKSNRNSVYKEIILTEEKKSINFDAQFKSYETTYRTAAQKGLLAGTYLSWITTFAILGVSVYTQNRANELLSLSSLNNIPTDQRINYKKQSDQFATISQATLYTTIAGLIISSGIMGWYLYSKEIYLGLEIDPSPNEWYANFKLKF